MNNVLHSSLIAALIAVGGVALSPAGSAAPQAPQAGSDDGLVLTSAGVDALLVDPKDAKLLAALHLLEQRLPEIPAEVGAPPLPPDAIRLPVQLLLGPMNLRAGVRAGDAFPFYAQLAFGASGGRDVQSLAGRFHQLLEGVGAPIEAGENGLKRLTGGPVGVAYGAVASQFVIALGEPLTTPLDIGAAGLPDGVEPVASFKIDFGQYAQGVAAAMEMSGGSGGDELSQMFELFGLGNLKLNSVVGHGSDRAYTVMTMPGYVSYLKETVGLPDAPLSRRALTAVPADAVWASVSTVDFQGLVDMLLDVLERSPENPFGDQDPLEMLRDVIGIHLQDDLFAHIGQEWGMYMSDRSGGGGLASLVIFAQLTDHDALNATLDQLEQTVNGFADAGAKGYVEFRKWDHEGTTYTTLMFPGLPVPLELTAATAEGYLVKGFTPQAAIAGVRQIRAGTTSLLDNPRFKEVSSGSLDDLFALSFLDTAELVGDGYGWSTLLCSAITNGVRSPGDPSRDVGMVLPMYEDLARGVKAQVMLSRLVGEDLVSSGQSDRSVLVNLTAILGVVDRIPALAAIPFAVAAGVTFMTQTSQTEWVIEVQPDSPEHDEAEEDSRRER